MCFLRRLLRLRDQGQHGAQLVVGDALHLPRRAVHGDVQPPNIISCIGWVIPACDFLTLDSDLLLVVLSKATEEIHLKSWSPKEAMFVKLLEKLVP